MEPSGVGQHVPVTGELRDSVFVPKLPGADSDRPKFLTSVVDFVFRALTVEYQRRDDLAHVAASEIDSNPIVAPSDISALREAREKTTSQTAEAERLRLPSPRQSLCAAAATRRPSSASSATVVILTHLLPSPGPMACISNV